jgi:hypothetical protein
MARDWYSEWYRDWYRDWYRNLYDTKRIASTSDKDDVTRKTIRTIVVMPHFHS